MKSEKMMRKIRLALNIAGLFAGATLLSAGHCGSSGNGSGGSHYVIQPDEVSK